MPAGGLAAPHGETVKFSHDLKRGLRPHQLLAQAGALAGEVSNLAGRRRTFGGDGRQGFSAAPGRAGRFPGLGPFPHLGSGTFACAPNRAGGQFALSDSARSDVDEEVHHMGNAIAPLDLSWLLIESPSSTTHVGAMLLFKKPPGRRNTGREIVEAYRGQRPLPPFNFVPELIGTSVPHFREVDGWDPYYHVQHLSLPAGSSYEELLRLVSDLHEPMLDRDRPLFRCWVIDGVPGGRFAIYTKTHHSIIDGVSGLKKLYDGLSLTDAPVILPPAFAQPRPPSKPRTPPPALHRLTGTLRGAIAQVGAINQISFGALRKGLSAVLGSHLEGSLPFVARHAPTNVPLKQARGFATASLPLEEMHHIGHQFGATLNDVAATVIDHGDRHGPLVRARFLLGGIQDLGDVFLGQAGLGFHDFLLGRLMQSADASEQGRPTLSLCGSGKSMPPQGDLYVTIRQPSAGATMNSFDTSMQRTQRSMRMHRLEGWPRRCNAP